jgi:hypothetical protein
MRNPLRRLLYLPIHLVPITQPPPGTSYCSNCNRDTQRDCLPGHGGPAWWFCTFCGVLDEDYPTQESA